MKGKYAYYALGEALAHLLSKKASFSLATGFARVYAAAFSRDLKSIMGNLKEIMPPATGVKELKKLAKTVVTDFAAYLVDFFYTYKFSGEFIKKHIEIRGLEHLDKELSRGKGVLLASAHLGNWEMGGMTLARMGYPIWGIAVKHKDERIDKIFQRRRAQNGLKIILLGSNLKNCYRVLRSNQILALNADRLFGEGGTAVDFFNRRVRFPRGIARLSLATGARIVPAFFIRNGYNQYFLEIQKPLEGRTEEEQVQHFAVRLEGIIRRHPTQWFIFQPFWEMPEWPN